MRQRWVARELMLQQVHNAGTLTLLMHELFGTFLRYQVAHKASVCVSVKDNIARAEPNEGGSCASASYCIFSYCAGLEVF